MERASEPASDPAVPQRTTGSPPGRRVPPASRWCSEAFKDLLKGWGRARDLIFVPQYEIETPAKERRYVDGALLHELRVPFGYWEAKDEKDDLDAEIDLKFRRGYPQDNIIFEDSRQAVLIQNRQEVIRCGVDDPAQLQQLLGAVLRLRAAGDRRVPQGCRAVQDRSARRARARCAT